MSQRPGRRADPLFFHAFQGPTDVSSGGRVERGTIPSCGAKKKKKFFWTFLFEAPVGTVVIPPLAPLASSSASLLVSRHNEEQLVCGVKPRTWPRVPVCAGEMAAALIVWHGAGAASCQKSSSDSPTGMMAHLTNASLTKRANDGGPN